MYGVLSLKSTAMSRKLQSFLYSFGVVFLLFFVMGLGACASHGETNEADDDDTLHVDDDSISDDDETDDDESDDDTSVNNPLFIADTARIETTSAGGSYVFGRFSYAPNVSVAYDQNGKYLWQVEYEDLLWQDIAMTVDENDSLIVGFEECLLYDDLNVCQSLGLEIVTFDVNGDLDSSSVLADTVFGGDFEVTNDTFLTLTTGKDGAPLGAASVVLWEQDSATSALIELAATEGNLDWTMSTDDATCLHQDAVFRTSGNLVVLNLIEDDPRITVEISEFDQMLAQVWSTSWEFPDSTDTDYKWRSSLALTVVGAVVAAGSLYKQVSGALKSFFLYVGSDGQILWSDSVDGQSITGVAAGPNEELYAIGGVGELGDQVPMVVKYDSDGNLVWQSVADGTRNQPTGVFQSMTIDNSGNVFAASDVIASLDPDGELRWAREFPEGRAYDIAVNSEGEVFAVGGAEESSRMITVKYDNNGTELWVAEFDANNP